MSSTVVIDDADDPRLQHFRRNDRAMASRADRRDDAGAGLFLAEGELVVERALDAGCAPVAALVDPAAPAFLVDRLAACGAAVFAAGTEVRRLVTGLGMVHAVVATFHRPARPTATELAARCDRLVLVEGVDNPANVGSIVRNAAALGWDGLVLDHTSADPLARRALRVAMGTAFTLPHARTRHLADLAGALGRGPGASHTVVALTPDAGAPTIGELSVGGPTALLVGAERSGLTDAALGAATVHARIPMSGGVDSLNAAAATAIACYVLGR